MGINGTQFCVFEEGRYFYSTTQLDLLHILPKSKLKYDRGVHWDITLYYVENHIIWDSNITIYIKITK